MSREMKKLIVLIGIVVMVIAALVMQSQIL